MSTTEPTAYSRPISERRGFVGRLMASLILGPWLARLARAAGSPVPAPAPESNTLVPGDVRLVLANALGGKSWVPSESVRLQVPQIAENGAIVPITVESHLPSTRRILIVAEKNPGPLIAEFAFDEGADAWVSTRIKLNDSAPVLAIAQTKGQFYGTQIEVRVMKGGCG